MRKPVWLFVGLRYLRAAKGNGFVSFVTLASVTGVALGVATLIVVLSVMNGFENELRERLLGLTSHASVLGSDAGSDHSLLDWKPLVTEITARPGIIGAAPYIELEVLLSGSAAMAGAILTGIEPSLEATVSRVDESMLLGQLDELQSGQRHIVLGRALAQALGVSVGDRVTVLVPQPSGLDGGVSSRVQGFILTGVFELGVQEHDGSRSFVHIDDAASLLGRPGALSGVRIETGNIFTAPRVVREQLAQLGGFSGLQVRDWTQENASYFRAIRIEKTMMALLLSLIIGVAAFNIVATLVMVVTEKRGGIAILRTLGCTRRDVIAIFVLQGTLIGWAGAAAGTLLGVWMALKIDTLAPALEQLFGFRFMPADLYYLTALPSDLRLGDVAGVALTVLLVTACATVYPAVRAAGVQPAEVLRYE